MVTKNKAIFLDRDGIINVAIVKNNKPYSPENISDVYLTDGIKELIQKWHEYGYRICVVTNQPDVARGLVSKDTVIEINNYLQKILNFDDIFVCWHKPDELCSCRKPNTYLFELAQAKYNIDFSESYMIGDRRSDILAGKNIGCKTIFIDYDYDEIKPTAQDFTFNSVKDILTIFEKEF